MGLEQSTAPDQYGTPTWGLDRSSDRGQPIMSAIMHATAVHGTTVSLRIVTESGDEIDYSSDRGLTMAIEDSAIFTEGQAEGAVVAMLSIDDFTDQNRLQVDSPRGQSDLVTIERTIALLSEVRDALFKTAATT